jgi:thioredoxin reductase (NADPH)
MTQTEIIIVGAGPAGISVAAESAYHGLKNVVVLEKGPSHNQTVLQYYPDDKRVDAAYRGQEAVCAGVLCFRDTTKPNFLSIVDEMLARYALPILYNVNVDSIRREPNGGFFVSATDGKSFSATTVVIAIGRMGKPNRPDYFSSIPASARKHVQFDIRNLTAAGKEVLVVGGGNSAVEFALSLAQRAKVTLSYRQDTFSRLNPMNLDLLLEDERKARIQILRNSNIEKVLAEGERPLVYFKEQAAPTAFDHMVFAIGGSSPAAFLENAGIQLDERGNPRLSSALETSVPGLYVAGELSVPQGKGSIIASFNSGKVVVEEITKRLGIVRKPEQVHLNP